MAGKITFEELILEMMPFSTELIAWCKTHPEFLSALKVIYSERFISLGTIVTSYSPNYPEDEVIGIYAYDYLKKTPVFKQDFVINKRKKNKEFILYTRNPRKGSSKYVKDINEFFATYGKNGIYFNSHHLTLEQLPEEIKERGQQAINIANRLSGGIMVKPTQEQIDRIHCELQTIKMGNWFIKRKIM